MELPLLPPLLPLPLLLPLLLECSPDDSSRARLWQERLASCLNDVDEAAAGREWVRAGSKRATIGQGIDRDRNDGTRTDGMALGCERGDES